MGFIWGGSVKPRWERTLERKEDAGNSQQKKGGNQGRRLTGKWFKVKTGRREATSQI